MYEETLRFLRMQARVSDAEGRIQAGVIETLLADNKEVILAAPARAMGGAAKARIKTKAIAGSKKNLPSK